MARSKKILKSCVTPKANDGGLEEREKRRGREEGGQLIKKELWDPPRSAPTVSTGPHCIKSLVRRPSRDRHAPYSTSMDDGTMLQLQAEMQAESGDPQAIPRCSESVRRGHKIQLASRTPSTRDSPSVPPKIMQGLRGAPSITRSIGHSKGRL